MVRHEENEVVPFLRANALGFTGHERRAISKVKDILAAKMSYYSGTIFEHIQED